MLFETGQTSKKLGGYPQDVVNRFLKTIGKLEAAQTLRDLYANKALALHEYQDHYSVRVTDSYRLELEIEFADQAKSKPVKAMILRLTKHYGD